MDLDDLMNLKSSLDKQIERAKMKKGVDQRKKRKKKQEQEQEQQQQQRDQLQQKPSSSSSSSRPRYLKSISVNHIDDESTVSSLEETSLRDSLRASLRQSLRSSFNKSSMRSALSRNIDNNDDESTVSTGDVEDLFQLLMSYEDAKIERGS